MVPRAKKKEKKKKNLNENPKIKIKKQTNAYRKKSSGQKFPSNLIHTKKTFKRTYNSFNIYDIDHEKT